MRRRSQSTFGPTTDATSWRCPTSVLISVVVYAGLPNAANSFVPVTTASSIKTGRCSQAPRLDRLTATTSRLRTTNCLFRGADMTTRIGNWFDERFGWRRVWEAIFLRKVPKVNWLYTLGSATLFLAVNQVVTGILLTIYYVPSPDHAYDSVQFITG